jgi:hypothetical protein
MFKRIKRWLGVESNADSGAGGDAFALHGTAIQGRDGTDGTGAAGGKGGKGGTAVALGRRSIAIGGKGGDGGDGSSSLNRD